MERYVQTRVNLTARAIAATLASAIASVSASAEVVFSTVNWRVPRSTAGGYVNVETLQTSTTSSNPPPPLGWDLHCYGSSTSSISWEKPSSPANSFGCVLGLGQGGTNIAVASLSLGTPIGPSSSFGTATSRTTDGGWLLNARNYFGFRFVASDNQIHYGWARMAIGPNMGDRIIDQIAWETAIDTVIAVGAMGPYEPCRDSNPILATGSNPVQMNLTAPSLDTDCGTIYKANYFKFSAPIDAEYTFDTCFSKADTTMAVLDACSGGRVLRCNDDACGASSQLTVPLTGGSTVYVVIGGTGEATDIPDTMLVEVHGPPVEACVQAAVLGYGDNAFDTATSGNGPLHVQRSMFDNSVAIMNHPVWFKFSPPVTGPYGFQTCDSVGKLTGDTLLAIGEYCPEVGSTFSTIAFNDDAPCSQGDSNRSYIDAINNGANGRGAGFPLAKDLVAGGTYYICVGTFEPKDQVIGSLHVIGPKYNTCPADLNHDDVVDGFDLAQLLASWGACP